MSQLFWLVLTVIAIGCASSGERADVTPVAPAVALRPGGAIVPLSEGLDTSQQTAQAIALNNDEVQTIAVAVNSDNLLRTEVFGVYPALAPQIAQHQDVCTESNCYRVDIYNFGNNRTGVAIVDVVLGQLIDFSVQANATPDLPPHLTARAVEIATTSAEVIAALGFDPTPADTTMPNVKTALNNTKCERSQHLCVAPTFIIDDRALWVIVDLVDERVVATRWTELGDFSAGLPTEELIAREDIFATFCEQENTLTRNGWSFDYMLTSTDGLRVANITYDGIARFRSIKLVDYHVSYSEREGFGYSDAVGCPMFSSAAVVALDAPVVEPIEQNGVMVGFALNQDYVHPQWPQPCNYRYMQRYEFYDDGSLRVMAANLGRGCGSDATYRFLYRIDLVGDLTLSEWRDDEWQKWKREQWTLDSGQPTNEGALLRLDGAKGGYTLIPNRGQFDDDSRGDNAYIYASLHKPDEGNADMVTLGVCCNSNYEQGPETFLDGESIVERDLVIWYVPQIENDDTPGNEYCWADTRIEDGLYKAQYWPCWAGPLLVPIQP